MKETNFVSSASYGDPRIRFEHQTLLQDYQKLQKETELTRRNLEMMNQKRLTLIAEVRFLRRKYKHFKQDQTLEASPEMFRLSESGDLVVPRQKHSGLRASVPCFDSRQKNAICNDKGAMANNASCDLVKKLKRRRGNEVLTNSISLPDLNGDENNLINIKGSCFDLNQISREEEEPEANGERMVAEALKNTVLGNAINDLHGELNLPICEDMEKELNRAVKKKKVSWQDPVALSV